jgi:hypothetical protein
MRLTALANEKPKTADKGAQKGKQEEIKELHVPTVVSLE